MAVDTSSLEILDNFKNFLWEGKSIGGMDSTEAIKWLMFIKNAYENLARNGMGMGHLVGKGIDCPVTVKTNGDLYRYHAVLAGDIIDALLELGKYKELEKQGKLLELPCAVGETVYELSHGMLPLRVGSYEIETDEIYANLVSDVYGYKYLKIRVDVANFGKTVFPTKEEAEAVLKELRKE